MKRMTAWMLAMAMLLSPVNAFAVTWGEICTGLRNGNSFSKDGVKAEKNEDITTVDGGCIEDVNFWNDIPSAMVIFKDTDISGEFQVVARDGKTYVVTLEEGVTVNVEDFNVFADGEGSSATLLNRGDVTSTDMMFAHSNDGGKVTVINDGKMTANDTWFVLADNDYMDKYEDGGKASYIEVVNNGTVDGELFVNVNGTSEANVDNACMITEGFILGTDDSSVGMLNNSGIVMGDMGGYTAGGSAVFVNRDTVGGMYVNVWNGGEVEIDNTGKVKDGSAYISVVPYEDKYATMKEIYEKGSEILAKIDVSGLTQEQIDGAARQYVDGGKYKAVYKVAMDENGKLYLVLIEQQKAEEEVPEKITEERYRHRMEEKRKEESIAGVYASPYWCRQLSLGYTNQNLWIHNANGDKINFREKLAWLWDGTPGKRLSLKVNLADPSGVTMRLDGTVFDTLERTEIDRLTILDKNENVYMDYDVKELKAAREAFGLAEDELLIVGGVDDPVMRMGTDGVIRPIEEM